MSLGPWTVERLRALMQRGYIAATSDRREPHLTSALVRHMFSECGSECPLPPKSRIMFLSRNRGVMYDARSLSDGE